MDTIHFDNLYFKDVDGDGKIQIAGGIDQVFDRELGIELSSSQAIRDYPELNQTLYLENPEDNLEVQLGFAPGAPIGQFNHIARPATTPDPTKTRGIKPGPAALGIIAIGVGVYIWETYGPGEEKPKLPDDTQIFFISPNAAFAEADGAEPIAEPETAEDIERDGEEKLESDDKAERDEGIERLELAAETYIAQANWGKAVTCYRKLARYFREQGSKTDMEDGNGTKASECYIQAAEYMERAAQLTNDRSEWIQAGDDWQQAFRFGYDWQTLGDTKDKGWRFEKKPNEKAVALLEKAIAAYEQANHNEAVDETKAMLSDYNRERPHGTKRVHMETLERRILRRAKLEEARGNKEKAGDLYLEYAKELLETKDPHYTKEAQECLKKAVSLYDPVAQFEKIKTATELLPSQGELGF